MLKTPQREETTMARPREFEESIVLDAAVRQFWQYGYEATSVRDLADSMNITGASLYNAFGDKRSLYKLSLDRYLETIRERIKRLEEGFSPRQAIVAFLEEIIARSLSDKLRCGCLLVNAALEVAPHDSEFQRIVAKKCWFRLRRFFFRCAVAGQKDGTIMKSQSPEDLAKMLLAILLGIRVLARTRPTRELLQGLVRPVFALLGDVSSTKSRTNA
jgi:TetR/AcrR family transcriptional repressor of nem operon